MGLLDQIKRKTGREGSRERMRERQIYAGKRKMHETERREERRQLTGLDDGVWAGCNNGFDK